jgi:hypothetical protein
MAKVLCRGDWNCVVWLSVTRFGVFHNRLFVEGQRLECSIGELYG